MRKRTVGRQRSEARGCARTMARLLWTAMLITELAGAWKPPVQPLLLNPRIHRTRSRRHATETAIHHLHLHGWHLHLQENQAIRSPFYDQCQFYKGRVLYEEESTATVTDCEGQLYGLVQVGKEEFILQPTRKPAGEHVLRRREVLLPEMTAYNLTGDTVADLELELDDDDDPVQMPHVRTRHERPHIQYYHDALPITRPVSGVKGLWLEMAIVADHTMLRFHGRERVKHYILALMNIVSAIFNDPSLGSNMTLVINKLFLHEEKDTVIKYGNVKKSLEAANKWNYRHLMRIPPEKSGWDATVWLTRSHLGGPSGFASVGGVCSKTRSAAVDRDEGLTSAFVIAHELAHLLGLTHDGDEQCEAEAHRGSVMAPTVLATLHNFAWSSCSKRQFHEKSRNWWCLHERSGEDGVELGGAKMLPNYVFTMDEQCRTEFGEGFAVCKSVKVRSACARLWCAHRSSVHVCHSKRGPPLEGTPCGHNHWCVDRVCEPMPGHLNGNRTTSMTAVDTQIPSTPQWEEWNEWSECGTDCGYGLRTRVRRCWYKGSLSASGCDGAGSQVASCWAGGACPTTRDIRADICRRHSTLMIPYLHPNESKHCEIWCVNYKGGDPITHGSLPDSTQCSYDRPFDLCYQGTCVKGQCNSSDATCNWCPDGYCNNNTHLYTKQLSRGWTRMAVIPHGAQQLSIQITTPVPLHIAIRERKRDKTVIELSNHVTRRFDIEEPQGKYLKYDSSVPQNLQIIEVDSNVIDIKEGHYGFEGRVVAAGTLIVWRQTDTDISLSSISQLHTDLMLMAVPEHDVSDEDTITVELSVNYTTPVGRTRPLEYRWSTERGPCSVTCGGGMRVVRTRCARGQRCPSPRYETCNTHKCEFVWVGGEWEECSATCGTHGIQERQLYCVPSYISASSGRELVKGSVSPALCVDSILPEKQRACNYLQCPVYWQEMPWTTCSTSCGRGVSMRPLVCPAENDSLCGPKPRERRRRCRLRRCPSTGRGPLTCPARDATQYCELFTIEQLKNNCAVPPFRRYCCNACRAAGG